MAARRPKTKGGPNRRKAARAAKEPRKQPGRFGIRTAPKGDRFHAPEMAIRKYALGMPGASEDYPWGHRAFRIGKKVFLFLAWDDGVFSATAKLPESQGIALTLPFAEPTGYGMGRSGWVTARFSGRDEVPVGLLCGWIEESYRAIAPKAPAPRQHPGRDQDRQQGGSSPPPGARPVEAVRRPDPAPGPDRATPPRARRGR